MRRWRAERTHTSVLSLWSYLRNERALKTWGGAATESLSVTHTISKVSEALELDGPTLNTVDGGGGMLSVAIVKVGRIELFVVGID